VEEVLRKNLFSRKLFWWRIVLQKLNGPLRRIQGSLQVLNAGKQWVFLNDSIAVFAFYTDELLVSGGPESIHGLPGMILGVGVPRLHTTWFATRVEVNGFNMNSVTPATKGKKVNYKNMIESIDKVLKNWGDYGRNMVINFMI
jgi:hypothetical protein